MDTATCIYGCLIVVSVNARKGEPIWREKKQHLQHLLKHYCQSPASTWLISWTIQFLRERDKQISLGAKNHPPQNVICSDYNEPDMIADKATVVHNLLFWSGHWAMRSYFKTYSALLYLMFIKSFFPMSKCSALSGRRPQTAVLCIERFQTDFSRLS